MMLLSFAVILADVVISVLSVYGKLHGNMTLVPSVAFILFNGGLAVSIFGVSYMLSRLSRYIFTERE